MCTLCEDILFISLRLLCDYCPLPLPTLPSDTLGEHILELKSVVMLFIPC